MSLGHREETHRKPFAWREANHKLAEMLRRPVSTVNSDRAISARNNKNGGQHSNYVENLKFLTNTYNQVA